MEPVSIVIITAVSTFLVVSGIKLFCIIRDKYNKKSYIHIHPVDTVTYNIL